MIIGPWVALGGLLALSCGARRAAPDAPPFASARSEADPDQGARLVPAHTEFSVELQTALSTLVTRPGTPLRARTLEPLRSEDGEIVVPDRAELFGYVTAVRPTPSPALAVRLERIETVWGDRSLRAGFSPVQADPSLQGAGPSGAGFESELLALGGIPLHGEATDSGVTSPVVLPPGARLRIVLVAPLLVGPRALPPELGGGAAHPTPHEDK